MRHATDRRTNHRAPPLPLRASRRGLLCRLLADERGAATTETVIMIPMYVIVWGCIVYVTQHFQNTIELRARVRRDAWAYAYGACQDPPGTNTSIATSRGLEPDPTGETGDPEGSARGAAGSLGGAFGAIDTIISYIPGLNFQTVVGSRSDFRTRRPAVIGGGELTVSASLTLLCNERPQSALSFIWSAVRGAFGF
jgi:hypothetical protein